MSAAEGACTVGTAATIDQAQEDVKVKALDDENVAACTSGQARVGPGTPQRYAIDIRKRPHWFMATPELPDTKKPVIITT